MERPTPARLPCSFVLSFNLVQLAYQGNARDIARRVWRIRIDIDCVETHCSRLKHLLGNFGGRLESNECSSRLIAGLPTNLSIPVDYHYFAFTRLNVRAFIA